MLDVAAGGHVPIKQDELELRGHAVDLLENLLAHLVRRFELPGDRVAGYLPNLPETLVAMLATTSLGATWSSCSRTR